MQNKEELVKTINESRIIILNEISLLTKRNEYLNSLLLAIENGDDEYVLSYLLNANVNYTAHLNNIFSAYEKEFNSSLEKIKNMLNEKES